MLMWAISGRSNADGQVNVKEDSCPIYLFSHRNQKQKQKQKKKTKTKAKQKADISTRISQKTQ